MFRKLAIVAGILATISGMVWFYRRYVATAVDGVFGEEMPARTGPIVVRGTDGERPTYEA